MCRGDELVQVPKGEPKTTSKRYTVTLRGVYCENIEALVDQGVYNESQDVIRQALRLLFEHHGIKLFHHKPATSSK